MNVFVCSLIRDFEVFRDAAASGVGALGHQAVRAEDFGASPGSSQAACLAGVRASAAMILLLGARYGHVQESGLSATHEEYREARGTGPVLVFIQQTIDAEPKQADFIREVQSWEQGHFTAEFRDAEHLRDQVIRALHDFVLASEAAPLDESELIQRARALVPISPNPVGTDLIFAVAGGPQRAVLRPAELEAEALHSFLMAEALTGADAVLTPSQGTKLTVSGDGVQLVQAQQGGFMSLDETGSIVLMQSAVDQDKWSSGVASIIEEVVLERITQAMRFCARVLDHVDAAQRISHVAPVATLTGAAYKPWRTRDEYERNPNRATMSMHGNEGKVIALSPPVRRRAALLHDTQQLAEDFTVRLRREVKG